MDRLAERLGLLIHLLNLDIYIELFRVCKPVLYITPRARALDYACVRATASHKSRPFHGAGTKWKAKLAGAGPGYGRLRIASELKCYTDTRSLYGVRCLYLRPFAQAYKACLSYPCPKGVTVLCTLRT